MFPSHRGLLRKLPLQCEAEMSLVWADNNGTKAGQAVPVLGVVENIEDLAKGRADEGLCAPRKEPYITINKSSRGARWMGRRDNRSGCTAGAESRTKKADLGSSFTTIGWDRFCGCPPRLRFVFFVLLKRFSLFLSLPSFYASLLELVIRLRWESFTMFSTVNYGNSCVSSPNPTLPIFFSNGFKAGGGTYTPAASMSFRDTPRHYVELRLCRGVRLAL